MDCFREVLVVECGLQHGNRCFAYIHAASYFAVAWLVYLFSVYLNIVELHIVAVRSYAERAVVLVLDTVYDNVYRKRLSVQSPILEQVLCLVVYLKVESLYCFVDYGRRFYGYYLVVYVCVNIEESEVGER